MTEQENDAIRIATHALGEISFETGGAFLDWIGEEAGRWSVFSASQSSASDDGVTDLGLKGSKEHSIEWSSFLEKAKAVAAHSSSKDLVPWERLAKNLEDRINSRNLLLSRSRAGRTVIELFGLDEPVARLAVSLSTGRDITRVIHPNNQRRLWKALAWLGIQSGNNERDDNLDETLSSIDISLAEARDTEREVSKIRESVVQDLEKDRLESRERLSAEISDLTAQVSSFIQGVQEEWHSLRETYDKSLALEAPRTYWNKRRVAHRLAAGAWGFAAFFTAIVSAYFVLPIGVDVLRGASTSKLDPVRVETGSIGAGVEQSFLAVLPELFQVFVVAFLLLWALRFCVRQAAQNLGRLQEATVRATMVETFLALSKPQGEGRILVEEADRAVIIQALFRPGGSEHIDDAPPVHWIEEVFRRVKRDNAKTAIG